MGSQAIKNRMPNGRLNEILTQNLIIIKFLVDR